MTKLRGRVILGPIIITISSKPWRIALSTAMVSPMKGWTKWRLSVKNLGLKTFSADSFLLS